MNEFFSFNDMRILDEEIEDHINDTMSAARFISLLEAEDPTVVEEAFETLAQCRVTLDISALPAVEGTGSDALRLKQEAAFESLEQITVGLEENDPLVLYLQELAATPAAGDLQMYAQCYLAGEHHYAEVMMQLCLGQVVRTALEYTGHGVLLLDLIQEGSMGLWESFPAYEGGDFMTHAIWWVRHSMAKAVVMQAYNSGLGSLLRRDMEEYLEADRELLTKLGRNPTREELGERLGLTEDEVLSLEKMIDDARSHEKSTQQVQEPEPTPDDDQAVEDTAYFQIRQRVAELLATLTEQQAKILSLRYGLEGGKPLSPEETGKRLGLMPAEVVAAEAAALAKLRTQ